MEPRELFEIAAQAQNQHYFWGNELDPAYKRYAERALQLRTRVTTLFDVAQQLGFDIEEAVIPFPTETRSGWLETAVTKRMLRLDFPAEAAIQSLVTGDEYGRDLVVMQAMIIGVHDVQHRHGIPLEVQDVDPAKSLDIITSFSVIDTRTEEEAGDQLLNGTHMLERLDVNYPVFPSREASFRVGGSDYQLDPQVDVTPAMEHEARARWRNGWGTTIEGMHAALDQVEKVLTRTAKTVE